MPSSSRVGSGAITGKSVTVGEGVEVGAGVGAGDGVEVGAGGVALGVGDGLGVAVAVAGGTAGVGLGMGVGCTVGVGAGVEVLSGVDGGATASGGSASRPAVTSTTATSATTATTPTTTPATAAVPAPTHAIGLATDHTTAGTVNSAPRRPRRSSGRHEASARRSGSSSFASMFEMWYFTVSALRPSRAAMSAFVPPSRSASSTRHSAGVKTSGWGGRPRRLRSMEPS